MNDNYSTNPNNRNAANGNNDDDCHGSHCGKEKKGCGNGNKSTDCGNSTNSNVKSGTPNQKGEQEYFPALEDENVEY